MKYLISYSKPNTHFINLEYIISNNQADSIQVQLPSWRPGRYELANFAKNIQKWAAFDESGKPLKFRKLTKDLWKIDAKAVPTIHIRYNYYAAQLDAGACRLDEKQLYVNPVHCFLYVPERINEPCTIELTIPVDYQVATSLSSLHPGEKSGFNGEHNKVWSFRSANFHELVDSPFIASNSLQYHTYVAGAKTFHLWFQGECRPAREKIVADFRKFTEAQIKLFGDFPAPEYHFLFQILPYLFHHGVEHLNSTVIALGPGYDLMRDDLYCEFLGVSSHELFHVWNIKTIRPVEMMPYNYTKENYSRLGFVAEGITTYYGDLILLRSGCYTEKEYFKTLQQRLQKHFDNYGRFNLSVADASFDTWLDGYAEGIPDRKTNIYTEGMLCALMLDVMIRKQTGNRKSLDDVMRTLYRDFGKKAIGYSEGDYQQAVEKAAGTSLHDFFSRYYYGREDYEPLLNDTLDYLGMELTRSDSENEYEGRFGFKINNTVGGFASVIAIALGSLAEKAGIGMNDEIICINKIRLKNNLKEWSYYFSGEPITLLLNTGHSTREVLLVPDKERYYPVYSVSRKSQLTEEQATNFKSWAE